MSAHVKLSYSAYSRVRERIMQDQGGECYYCLEPVYVSWRDAPPGKFDPKRFATIDHIEPLSRGGTWKRYNLVIACRDCNSRKGNMSEEEFHEIMMTRFRCEEIVDAA